MNVLITGGAGYVGVPLAKLLLAEGCEVTVLDNGANGWHAMVPLAGHYDLIVDPKDIRAVTEWDVKGFDAVVHLAGISGYPACEADPMAAREINLDATRRLVSLLDPSQLLIYASTTHIYGAATEPCTEETACNATDTYSVTKYQAELAVMERENSVSLRKATLFGVAPNMRHTLLPNDFVRNAMRDGKLSVYQGNNKRTFLHVADAVRVYWDFLNVGGDPMRGQVYNVGAEHLSMTKSEVAEIVAEVTDCEVVVSPHGETDVRDFVPVYDKIAARGFEPMWNMREGVAELVQLYSFLEAKP